MSLLVPVFVVLFFAALLYYLLQDDGQVNLDVESFINELIQHDLNKGLTPDIGTIVERNFKHFDTLTSREEAMELTSKVPVIIFKLMGEKQTLADYLSPHLDDLAFYNTCCAKREELVKTLKIKHISSEHIEARNKTTRESKTFSTLLTAAITFTIIAAIIFILFWFVQNGNTRAATLGKSTRPNFLLYVFFTLFTLPGILWMYHFLKKRK